MIVIKVGGSQGIDLDFVCDDLASLWKAGMHLVLIHGAGREADELGSRLGHPSQHLTSTQGFTWRRTDRNTLEIFAMASVGKVNILLVERLQRLGVNAMGLSGLSGRLMEGTRKETVRIIENGRQRILRDDYTGRVERVNGALLLALLNMKYLPVIAPVGISYRGEAMNVDGDRAAAVIAGTLHAEKLVILTNVPGLMRNFPDESSLIARIEKRNLTDSISFAEGRMKKKVLGASEALDLGVKQVIFADGRIEHPIQRALEGRGTIIE
ncbi:MAG: [LysW]-aminoadipate kinase [Acidobacteriota bacterium]